MLLALFCCPALLAQYDLSICAIFQDEAPYLKEWIEFHKLQGVEHFYLYNNLSGDDFQEVLAPYVKNKEVTLREWPDTYEEGEHAQWIAIQSRAYMDCIRQDGRDNRWMAFIDPDEFLFCPSGKKLTSFLKAYRKFGGVCVNWLKFGTSHVEEIPPGSLLIENLIFSSLLDDSENRPIKSIVQPKWVKDCNSAHHFLYKKNHFAVDEDKNRMEPKNLSRTVRFSKIRINHYWTRTEMYLREKKIPSRLKRRPEYTVERQMEMAEKYNQRIDRKILQFVVPLKLAMGSRS